MNISTLSGQLFKDIPDLHHHAGLVPLLVVVAVLLLDDDVISNLQPVSREPPVLSGDKLAWLERKSVTENTADY